MDGLGENGMAKASGDHLDTVGPGGSAEKRCDGTMASNGCNDGNDSCEKEPLCQYVVLQKSVNKEEEGYTALAVSDKLIAVGTGNGSVHLVDYNGDMVRVSGCVYFFFVSCAFCYVYICIVCVCVCTDMYMNFGC